MTTCDKEHRREQKHATHQARGFAHRVTGLRGGSCCGGGAEHVGLALRALQPLAAARVGALFVQDVQLARHAAELLMRRLGRGLERAVLRLQRVPLLCARHSLECVSYIPGDDRTPEEPSTDRALCNLHTTLGNDAPAVQ